MGHWENWYSAHCRSEPSPFARWVPYVLQPASVLLEVGCGDGIDAMYYAAQGYHVFERLGGGNFSSRSIFIKEG